MEINRYESFISETIRWETGGDKQGGYTDDPKDAGGETKWGISKRANPDVNIKDLTYKQAVELYRTRYYTPYIDLIMSENVAFKLFDMGVLCGPITALKVLQETVVKEGKLTLAIDGKLGPITLTAVHMTMATAGEREFYAAYVDRLKKRFFWIAVRKPWNKKFLKGWYNRAGFLFKPFLEKVNNEVKSD